MSKWKLYKRTSEPEYKIAIKSKRLRAALADVWQAIPAGDRDQLNDLLMLVSDASILRYILADQFFEDLYGAAIPTGAARYFIFLNASTLHRKPASYLHYVVAHELAHVYHQHKRQNSKRMETEADATAARWGYSEPTTKG